MAVSLQEVVAIFISALYNLCKWYLGNRPIGFDISFPTSTSTVATVPVSSVSRARTAKTSYKLGSTLLTSNTAYIMLVIPAATEDVAANYLVNRGFNLNVTKGSLADWTAMVNAGFVLNSGHGLLFTDKKLVTRFMQQVSDLVTADLDAQYASLLASGQLAKITVTEFDSNANATHLEYYALTSTWPGFTASTFAPNSLYFNESCLGYRLDDFPQALFALGVGGYLGWTFPVMSGDAGDTVAMFLDRALGYNEFAPTAAVAQPPRPWQTAAAQLSGLTRPGESYDFATSMNPQTKGQTHLKFQAGKSSTLNTLIPSIVSGNLSEDGTQYVLTGDFGTTQGTAKIGTTSVNVASWSDTTVTLTIDSSLSGEKVVLTVDGLQSNPLDYYNLTITPTKATIAPGSRQTFTVTPPKGVTGTIEYAWTQTSATGTFSASDGTGNSLTTTQTSVDLVTTASDQGTITVSVIASTTAGSTKTVVGKGRALITLSSAKHIIFNIPSNLKSGDTVTVTATLQNIPETGYYQWQASYGTVNGVAPVFRYGLNTVWVSTSILSIQYTVPTSQYLLYDTLMLQVNDSTGKSVAYDVSPDIIWNP